MNLTVRALVIIFIVGLVLLVASLQAPAQSTNQYVPSSPAGSQLSQIYFFQPMTVSISVSGLLGSATLIVQQVNYNGSFQAPLVNSSVVAQDIVTFSIPSRGYYAVSFAYSNGSTPALSYVLDESGIPTDTLVVGIALMASAGALYFTVIYSSRIKSRSP